MRLISLHFQPTVAAMSEYDQNAELSAILGEGCEYEGKMTFVGQIRIDGSFKGEIRGKGTLVVGKNAHVDAKMDIGTLIVLGGEVHGQVEASHVVELNAPSQVFADITTPQVFVDRGVELIGKCTTVPRAGKSPKNDLASDNTGSNGANVDHGIAADNANDVDNGIAADNANDVVKSTPTSAD